MLAYACIGFDPLLKVQIASPSHCQQKQRSFHGYVKDFKHYASEGINYRQRTQGKGFRKGSVDERTQVENPKTDDWVKRNQDPNSENEGEFMDNKQDGKPFKGVAKEPDDRRK